jgi:hypothetical protein
VPWSETLPLIASLTAQRIGQLWLDHTGHNTDRQYGSSTKSWRFDTVGIMTPLPDDQRRPYEVAFQLSFEHPGKARRRTPANWADFETCTVRLADDRWTSEPVNPGRPSGGKAPERDVKPSIKVFHESLFAAISADPSGRGQTTREAWEAASIRRGLVEPFDPKDDYKAKDRKRKLLRTAQSTLIAAKWIAVDGQRVMDLTKPWA